MAIVSRNWNRVSIAAVMMCGIAVQGCTTTSADGRKVRSTAMDRAVSECVASVAIGAISGAVIGGVIGGSRGMGRGAAIGAVAGVGRCAILMEIAAAEDRAKVREAELAALQSNRAQTRSITTKNGKSATVRTKVTPAPLPVAKAEKPAPVEVVQPAATPAAPQTSATAVASYAEELNSDYTACRFTELLIDMDGGTADAGKQKWCKSSQGDWEPVTG
ncbi:hypothetical protein [Hoeflea sp.]|uniref:hypothetical protein n=1 Tax=Hoeflea sp. TaxID=1940281 RepID=UPI003A93DE07